MPKKKTLSKKEIWARLGTVLSILDQGRITDARMELFGIRQGMLQELPTPPHPGTDESDALILGQIITCGPILGGVQKKDPKIYMLDGKLFFPSPYMMVSGCANPTGVLPEATPMGGMEAAIRKLTGVDYSEPGTERFPVPPADILEKGIRSLSRTLLADRVLYSFKDGPSAKAALLLWGVKLTGASCIYTKPGEAFASKRYNSALYMHGEKYDAFIMPVCGSPQGEACFREACSSKSVLLSQLQ